jgi:hypothetical protein
MDRAYDGEGFTALNISTPCCGFQTSLKDLKYGWPVGFARFFLEAFNPGAQGLSDEMIQRVGEALGARVCQVQVHV